MTLYLVYTWCILGEYLVTTWLLLAYSIVVYAQHVALWSHVAGLWVPQGGFLLPLDVGCSHRSRFNLKDAPLALQSAEKRCDCMQKVLETAGVTNFTECELCDTTPNSRFLASWECQKVCKHWSFRSRAMP
jgi:hypothetical protein